MKFCLTLVACILLLARSSGSGTEDDGHCIWYDECGVGYNNSPLNCAYNGSAIKLNDTVALGLLKTLCPSLYHGDNNSYTCCSAKQLHTIDRNMNLPRQFFSRCPTCYRNFVAIYCYMTCAPNQSKFVQPDPNAPPPPSQQSSDETNGVTTKPSVPGILYYMTYEYAERTYNSCKNVLMPSANTKAISTFCGKSAEKCNATNWIEYMGNTGNGRAPFPITPKIDSKNWTTPLNVSVKGCNETYSNGTTPCSCQDCESSCTPLPPLPPQKKPFKILGLDGYAVIMGCLFIAFLIFFGTYVLCYNIVTRNAFDIDDDNSIDKYYGYSVNGKRHSNRNRVSHMQTKRERVSPADIGCMEKIGARLERALCYVFRVWGTFCAKHPIIIVVASLAVYACFAGGIAKYDVTTDPVKLWSAPESTARQQKDYFDQHFGPFYRTEELIITRPNNKTKVPHQYPPPSTDYVYFSSLFDKDFMTEVLELQDAVASLTAVHDNKTVTLQDICFKPLSPDNNECTIESVLQYYQNNVSHLDAVNKDIFYTYADYLDHFLHCSQGPAAVSDTTKLNMTCLANYSGPVFPWVVLGGYDGDNYSNATAFVIVFIINNHLDEELNKPAEAWEKEFIKFMKNFSSPNMSVAFSAERSIQDEIDRESSSDVFTIALSYIIMFVYISIALGDFKSLDTILIDSKIMLGLSGVFIVLLSVAASVGFFSYCGVPMTLIIIEVVPFLVLAVGVDNIFILVQTYQRDKRRSGETLEEHIGRIVGTVGPSMLLTSCSESIAFFFGAMTHMPAVREFSLYAAMAVLFDFILQITCFVGLMTFDAMRQESNRFDICCCLKLPKKEKEEEADCQCGLFYLVKKYYSRWLMYEWVRPLVIVVFVGYFFASIAMVFHIEIGLDQALSMPQDSYVLDFFGNLSMYLSVGAPVYFVVPQGHNYLTRGGQNSICGGNGCLQDSLAGQVYTASRRDNYTLIAQPASSWLDDYFDWIQPGAQLPCCRQFKSNKTFCAATVKDNGTCEPCDLKQFVDKRPVKEDFMKYLPWFLKDNPGTMCAKGGHAAYGSAVNLIQNKTEVGATYFMTFHTILKTSTDYINALKEARVIAKNISTAMNISDSKDEIFPYSVFYVFYEQYLTMIYQTCFNIGICLLSILIVSTILLGFDFHSATLISFVILMIVIDIMGMMYMWNIPLNALSLVNLVMAIGIAVEFCSHIARAFAVSLLQTRVERAKDALANVGSSVLSGITLTKLGGIIVLAFSKSQLFQVFYFRMYMGMVVFGASHGLIFLPVLLSYIGPPVNKAKLLFSQQMEKDLENNKVINTGHVNTSDSADLLENEVLIHNDSPPPSYNSVHT